MLGINETDSLSLLIGLEKMGTHKSLFSLNIYELGDKKLCGQKKITNLKILRVILEEQHKFK